MATERDMQREQRAKAKRLEAADRWLNFETLMHERDHAWALMEASSERATEAARAESAATIEALRAENERLREACVRESGNGVWRCGACHAWAFTVETLCHAPDCPAKEPSR